MFKNVKIFPQRSTAHPQWRMFSLVSRGMIKPEMVRKENKKIVENVHGRVPPQNIDAGKIPSRIYPPSPDATPRNSRSYPRRGFLRVQASPHLPGNARTLKIGDPIDLVSLAEKMKAMGTLGTKLAE